MKLFSIVLLFLFCLLQYDLWLGEKGVGYYQALQAAQQALKAEVRQREERNGTLGLEVADLKQGLEAIEERARYEMGMIKHGETFYQIIDYQPASEASSFAQVP